MLAFEGKGGRGGVDLLCASEDGFMNLVVFSNVFVFVLELDTL